MSNQIEAFLQELGNHKETQTLVEPLKKGLNPKGNDDKLPRENIQNSGNGELAFFFGAGISMADPFRLCGWDKLLQYAFLGRFYALHTETIKNTSFSEFLEELTRHDAKAGKYNFFDGFDLYELAEYIELGLKDQMKGQTSGLDAAWRSALYRVVESSLYYDLKQDGSKEFPEGSKVDEGLVKQLCDIVHKKGIKTIITYNYDDVFEAVYARQYGEKAVYPVFIDDQLPSLNKESKGEVDIYHVHGFIPHFRGNANFGVDDKYYNHPEAKWLVLSEESYEQTAHESYIWRNAIQVDTLLRHKCVFFGFSATDKNFKRLVRLMGRSIEDADGKHPSEHYIFLSVDTYIKNIFGKGIKDLTSGMKTASGKEIKDLRVRCEFLIAVLEDKTRYLKHNHLIPIWTTNEDILSEMISWNASLREDG